MIGALGYTEVNLRLYEDEENPNKKIPRISAEVGIILILGTSEKKIKIKDYQK